MDKTVGVQESHYETLLRRFLVTTTDDYALQSVVLGLSSIDFYVPAKISRLCVDVTLECGILAVPLEAGLH